MKEKRVIALAGLMVIGATILWGVWFLSHRASNFDLTGTTFPTHAFAQGRLWTLEIAHTESLRALGLGERDVLPQKTGMLFLFETPGQYGFWMKGMRFPIDIIFLTHGTIVYIERGITVDDQRVIVPPVPIDQVLEVNAGEAAPLRPGDRVWYWRGLW